MRILKHIYVYTHIFVSFAHFLMFVLFILYSCMCVCVNHHMCGGSSRCAQLNAIPAANINITFVETDGRDRARAFVAQHLMYILCGAVYFVRRKTIYMTSMHHLCACVCVWWQLYLHVDEVFFHLKKRVHFAC